MNKQATANSSSILDDLMDTRILMICSALFLGLLGMSLTFAPAEILALYNTEPHQFTILLTKAAGALYLGFAMLNWMGRGNLIGGIYSRPVALGNFLHFFMMAIVLVEETLFSSLSTAFIIVGILYAIFALLFGYLLFSGGKVCK